MRNNNQWAEDLMVAMREDMRRGTTQGHRMGLPTEDEQHRAAYQRREGHPVALRWYEEPEPYYF